MTEKELQEFSERNWARVDAAKRDKCVWHLRELLGEEAKSDLWTAFDKGEHDGFHFFAGMGVRNALRQIMKDNELPEVEYPSGHAYRNWDDFYMAALRQAVAPKEGEV